MEVSDDDDAPPALVTVQATPSNNETSTPDNIKVPITIVTGKTIPCIIFAPSTTITKHLISTRLSRRWQDHTIKLHLKGKARQKDCRYIEWPVNTRILYRCHRIPN